MITWDQLSEMRSEHRAWVSVAGTPIVTDPISSDSSGVNISLAFPLKNTGESPASAAFVNTDASAFGLATQAWQEKVCKEPTHGAGTSVFPGDEVLFTTTVSVSASDIARISKMFPPPIFISPAVAACVVYRDAVTGKWHHTPLVLRVYSGRDGKRAIALKDLPLNPTQVAIKFWPLTAPPD